MTGPDFDDRALARIETAAQVLAAAGLLLVLWRGLLPALLAALLIHQLVYFALPPLRRMGFTLSVGKSIALSVPLIALTVAIVVGSLKLVAFLRRGFSDIVDLLQKMAEIVGTARLYLPAWAQEYLPADTEEVQVAVAAWIQEHAGHLGGIGQGVGKFLFYVVVGIAIGGLLALEVRQQEPGSGPLTRALVRRSRLLSTAFRNIVFSQVRISALNTLLTGLYLAVALPLFGVELPLVKTMIAVTFLVGLLPVIGNLLSNTVIVVVSLSVSPYVALASLAFLVVIHKLEYFVNARIIGSRIRARAWELLAAMLVAEACFGVPGLVAAPILYAYGKDELAARRLL